MYMIDIPNINMCLSFLPGAYSTFINLFNVEIRCNNLSTPANGEITSCSSGRVGVGHEGDTCSFTCNIGYGIIGINPRTCQSDGNWSGSDVVCEQSK